jgi:hypothetical protein
MGNSQSSKLILRMHYNLQAMYMNFYRGAMIYDGIMQTQYYPYLCWWPGFSKCASNIILSNVFFFSTTSFDLVLMIN